MNNPQQAEGSFREWSYMEDELGILYCLGRAVDSIRHEVVAAYYQSANEISTKQSLENDATYRRFVYQGLPEERDRMDTIERPEVLEKLLAHTSIAETGIFLAPDTLTPGDNRYREVATWLESGHPKAGFFQDALQIGCSALLKAGVTLDQLVLYGAASYGLVAISSEPVDDIDLVFSTENISELREAVNELQSPFTWSEIDPHGRLLRKRQLLKAKRWATSQIRLEEPYPMSIDLKVERQPGAPSLWDDLPEDAIRQPYSGVLRVIDDAEGYCTSPALRCEDKAGEERILLLEGYQYIGCSIMGDVISVSGDACVDSSVIVVTQSDEHNVMPDFSNVPVV